jgi:predicted transcriptional regulator of viral defense system
MMKSGEGLAEMYGRGTKTVPLRYIPAMNLPAFLAKHPVFTVDQFCAADPATDRNAMKKRLQRAQASGKVKRVARGIYAAVPPGQNPETFQPDPFLVLKARDPDVIFCGHSALELNGLAYSVWNEVSAYRTGKRNRAEAEGTGYRFYRPPLAFTAEQHKSVGVTTVDRHGVLLRTLSPERALVEGFRNPAPYGGLGEFVQSMRGIVRLRWPILSAVLNIYAERTLYGCVGWFLETLPTDIGMKAEFLAYLRGNQPRLPHAISRSMGATRKVERWNLLIPEQILNLEERGAEEF